MPKYAVMMPCAGWCGVCRDMKAVERLMDPSLAAQAITDRDRGRLEHLAEEYAG